MLFNIQHAALAGILTLPHTLLGMTLYQGDKMVGDEALYKIGKYAEPPSNQLQNTLTQPYQPIIFQPDREHIVNHQTSVRPQKLNLVVLCLMRTENFYHRSQNLIMKIITV